MSRYTAGRPGNLGRNTASDRYKASTRWVTNKLKRIIKNQPEINTEKEARAYWESTLGVRPSDRIPNRQKQAARKKAALRLLASG